MIYKKNKHKNAIFHKKIIYNCLTLIQHFFHAIVSIFQFASGYIQIQNKHPTQ
jgi:hypothetical protein